MAKNIAPIAMPGADSNRTDKGLVQRVQKVQRDANFNRASGGAYNERNTINSLTVGTNMATTGSAVSQDVPTPPVSSTVQALPPINAFAPGSAGDVPYSQGSPYGDGAKYTNIPSVGIPDAGSAVARALLAQNPTNPQLIAIVQAFNEAGM
jgi:hypothetical protein